MTDDATQNNDDNVFDPIAADARAMRLTQEREKLAQELAQARAQRDMAGQAAAHWIGRFYGLRAAHGDIPALNVSQLVEGELRALEASLNPQPQA